MPGAAATTAEAPRAPEERNPAETDAEAGGLSRAARASAPGLLLAQPRGGSPGCSPSNAGEVLAGGPEERRWSGDSCGGSGIVCTGWLELEDNLPAQRADKAGATTRNWEGGRATDPGATRLGSPAPGEYYSERREISSWL